MSSVNSSRGTRYTEPAALPPSVVYQQQHVPSPGHDLPTSRELQRFIDRRRAQELGFELPLNTREAAAYVGMHYKTVERKARDGEIPAHPASGVRRKTWKFYPSELDAWLRAKISSNRHPCPPNGKDTIQ